MPADPSILKRIRRSAFARGGRALPRQRLQPVRAALQPAVGAPAPDRRGDEVVVLYPSHRGWQALGDFGTVPMPLDHALEMISTNPYFRQLRQDFE
jgi:hypothetical protein